MARAPTQKQIVKKQVTVIVERAFEYLAESGRIPHTNTQAIRTLKSCCCDALTSFNENQSPLDLDRMQSDKDLDGLSKEVLKFAHVVDRRTGTVPETMFFSTTYLKEVQ